MALQQPAEVGEPELAVAVGERDQVVTGGAEAAPERRAVALVDLVVDDPHDVGMGFGEPVRQLGGPVATAVVDRDDLEGLGERRQDLQRLGDEGLDVLRLVVGGEEVGERGDPRACGGDVGHRDSIWEGHQPSRMPHQTPQALMRIEATTSATVHHRTPSLAMAIVTSTRANGA